MRLTPLGRNVLIVVILAAAGLLGWKYFGKPPVDCAGLLGRPLRVGVVTWPGYAGGIVANNGFKPNKDCIYYKQHNLCVEFMLMEDVDARAKAFARGGTDGVDIVWSTVDFWANELPGFVKNEIKARAIMQVDWSRGGDAIVADNSIKRIEDLHQKKVSLALFTPSHWLLEYNLQNSSLDEAKQSEIVKGLVGKNASPDARADFVAGKVDAAVVWEPDVAEALQKRPNSHVLVSTRQARKLIADLMVAREDFIKQHPDVIQAFVEGWIVDGTEKANRDPDTVVRLLMENESLYKDLGPEVTKQNLAAVKWADLADNTETFNIDGKDPEALYDRIFNQAGKSWVARGYISSTISPAVSKDDSFLRKIYQRRPVERVPDTIPSPAKEILTQTPTSVKPVTVNFPSGSATLDAPSKQVIDEQVALLPKTMSGAYIRVEGNTDSTGSAAVNRALSQRRAQAVIDYLTGNRYNLPKQQFIAVGNGPDKPVATNDTAEGKAKNRRTDVSVISPSR
jgi:NitT/TauT family transport system substrate-binding protein